MNWDYLSGWFACLIYIQIRDYLRARKEQS